MFNQVYLISTCAAAHGVWLLSTLSSHKNTQHCFKALAWAKIKQIRVLLFPERKIQHCVLVLYRYLPII